MHTVRKLAIVEESIIAFEVLVRLEDVDGQDHRARRDLRWFVYQKPGVVQLELADLEGHI